MLQNVQKVVPQFTLKQHLVGQNAPWKTLVMLDTEKL